MMFEEILSNAEFRERLSDEQKAAIERLASWPQERAKRAARIRRYDGSFLHAVDVRDVVRCNNLSLAGWISSPEIAAVLDDTLWPVHTSPRDVPIEQLATSPPQGIPTNFAVYRVYVASMIRAGPQVGHGVEDPIMLSPDEHRCLLRLGDIELEFERVRREVAPDAASRLTSLFVVDDSTAGRRLLKEMFPGPDVYVVKVAIPTAIRVTRADVAWYEAYVRDDRREFLDSYWTGTSSKPGAPRWEYLVEGKIELTNPAHRRYLRRVGGAAFGLPGGLPGPPI